MRPARLAAALALAGAAWAHARPVGWQNNGVGLAGELIAPAAAKPRGYALLLPGSGPLRLHDRGPGFQLYRELEEALLASGFGVLEYDKRGTGGSQGDFASASLEDQAADAQSALGFLRGFAGSAALLGVVGHSEGGWLAARAAGSAKAGAGFIALVCTPVEDGAAFVIDQQRAREKAAHRSPAETQADLGYFSSMVDAIRREPDDARASLEIWRSYRAIYPHELDSAGRMDPMTRAEILLQMRTFESPWTRSLLVLRPLRDLAGFRGPLLAIWSDEDEQVPADPNARLFRSRPGASPADQTLECRALDHFLRPAGNRDGPAERARVLREFRQWLDRLP